jgi:uncharacterized iron-regulated membrane protein
MPLKAIVLRLHRWIALAATLPLLLVILSGLVLTFEPVAQKMGGERLTLPAVEALLARHDPEGRATSLALRRYDGTASIGGIGEDGGIDVELASGRVIEEDRPFSPTEIFRFSRGLHEHLLYELYWVVTLSTFAMLVLAPLGLLLGWPRPRNTVAGWHRTAAWVALPLLIASPLTGLFLVYGITFAPPGAQQLGRGERPAILEALRTIAATHDVDDIVAVRPRGGRLMARVFVGDELKSFVVTRQGLVPLTTNWPRALHEGNWHSVWGPLANLIVSIVSLGLLVTGLIVWARRKFRPRIGVRERRLRTA